MAKVIDNMFDFGETVYLKTDKEQLPRIVFCLKCYKNEVLYDLACGTTVSSHYEFEIAKEANILITSTD